MRRSMLFLPGNTPNMLINGSHLGSDALIFDLEDAVSPAEKDSARILVRNTLKYMDLGGCETIVRINSIDTDYWKKDLDAIIPQKPNLIMLPKTNFAQDAKTADEYALNALTQQGIVSAWCLGNNSTIRYNDLSMKPQEIFSYDDVTYSAVFVD